MAPMALYQLLMEDAALRLWQLCPGYRKSYRKQAEPTGQWEGFQGKREQHRVQKYRPAQVPNPCIPANKTGDPVIR